MTNYISVSLPADVFLHENEKTHIHQPQLNKLSLSSEKTRGLHSDLIILCAIKPRIKASLSSCSQCCTHTGSPFSTYLSFPMVS